MSAPTKTGASLGHQYLHVQGRAVVFEYYITTVHSAQSEVWGELCRKIQFRLS